MKYLKKFNENKQPTIVDIDSIKKMGDQCFAYLYDEGYEFSVWDDDDYELIRIDLAKGDNGSLDDFNWIDVKDYFIPFLNILNNKYNLDNAEIVFYHMDNEHEFLNFNDINEDYDGGYYLYSIQISFWKFTDVNEKKINESWHEEFPNLIRFSKDCLSYILDDIKIDYRHLSSFINKETKKLNDIMTIEIKPNSKFDRHRIGWSDIKDYFIPYITLLNETYPIYDLNNLSTNFPKGVAICFKQGSSRNYESSVDTIINDDLEYMVHIYNREKRMKLDLEFLTEITLYVLV